MTTPEPFRWEESAVELSPDGRARRDAILDFSRRALRGRARRRRVVRSASALAILAVVCGGAYVVTGPVAGPHRAGPTIADAPLQTDPTPVHVTFVRTDDSITARAAISDDELLRLLGEAGRPAGLVRVQGRTLLSTELERPSAETAPAPSRT